jgi:glycerol transport system ATP-binding protein
VVVMTVGPRIGKASDLFERPNLVGYFIGSPGMNFLPARVTPRASAWRDIGDQRAARRQ